MTDVITKITPIQRRIISVLCDVANLPTVATDAKRLRKLARNAGPRHVEAWMLTTNPDLAVLDDATFRHELVVALYCIDEKGEDASEELADRRGIPQIGIEGTA